MAQAGCLRHTTETVAGVFGGSCGTNSEGPPKPSVGQTLLKTSVPGSAPNSHMKCPKSGPLTSLINLGVLGGFGPERPETSITKRIEGVLNITHITPNPKDLPQEALADSAGMTARRVRASTLPTTVHASGFRGFWFRGLRFRGFGV